MGTPTSHYGIVKPSGSDPFRAADFATAYDLIDQKIYEAATAASGGTGGTGGTIGDASTLQGHPASYFYSPANPPPGGSGSTDALTLQGHNAAYFYSPANPPPSSGGGTSGHITTGTTTALSGRFASFTPDSSGYHDITHGFGFTPGVVVASGLGPTGGAGIPAMILPHNFTSTTLRVRVLDSNGNPVTSAVTIMLLGAN